MQSTRNGGYYSMDIKFAFILSVLTTDFFVCFFETPSQKEKKKHNFLVIETSQNAK